MHATVCDMMLLSSTAPCYLFLYSSTVNALSSVTFCCTYLYDEVTLCCTQLPIPPAREMCPPTPYTMAPLHASTQAFVSRPQSGQLPPIARPHTHVSGLLGKAPVQPAPLPPPCPNAGGPTALSGAADSGMCPAPRAAITRRRHRRGEARRGAEPCPVLLPAPPPPRPGPPPVAKPGQERSQLLLLRSLQSPSRCPGGAIGEHKGGLLGTAQGKGAGGGASGTTGATYHESGRGSERDGRGQRRSGGSGRGAAGPARPGQERRLEGASGPARCGSACAAWSPAAFCAAAPAPRATFGAGGWGKEGVNQGGGGREGGRQRPSRASAVLAVGLPLSSGAALRSPLRGGP